VSKKKSLTLSQFIGHLGGYEDEKNGLKLIPDPFLQWGEIG
jgi:hypothetical protein